MTLCNARGTRDIPVAEWVVGAIVGAASGLLGSARDRGLGAPAAGRGPRLAGLIVGHGSIGRATAERLEALGAHVTGIGRDGELMRLVAEADTVVNWCR